MPSHVHRYNNSGDYQNDSESPTRSLHQLQSSSSYELGPHPADPHSTVLPTSLTGAGSPLSPSLHSNFVPSADEHGATDGTDNGNGSWGEHRFGPSTCTERVPGQELWVYGGRGRFVYLTLPANVIFTPSKHVHVLALPYQSSTCTTRDGNQLFGEQRATNGILGSW